MDKSWMCNIEWDGHRKATRRESGAKKSNMSKLIHNQLPTMSIMQRNGSSSNDVCPLCKKEQETWEHVLKCTCENAKLERISQLGNIKKC